MFIFYRYRHSSAAVIPVKYECDSKDLRVTFARSKILLTEELTNGALVTPTPDLFPWPFLASMWRTCNIHNQCIPPASRDFIPALTHQRIKQHGSFATNLSTFPLYKVGKMFPKHHRHMTIATMLCVNCYVRRWGLRSYMPHWDWINCKIKVRSISRR